MAASETMVANFTSRKQREPKEGYLESFAETGALVAAAAWKKRWIVLFNKQITVYKKDKHDGKSLLSMDLEGCGVKQYVNSTKKNCFQVFHPTKADLILRANSQQEMEDWMKAIRDELTQGNFGGIGTPIEIQGVDLDWTNDVIGKGGSGLVKKGLWLKSIPVAIKTLNNLPEFLDEEELESFFKEMAILSDMRHPNVVSMYGFCRKDNYICLVTEFITGGDLSSCLKDKSKPLTRPLQCELASNISAAMIYLHGRNLIHRDLKPGNILVEDWETGKVKVCDFGLSRIKTPGEKAQTVEMFGSPAYAAPELNTPDHTHKVDVFSFSIILWEIDTRQPAWANLDKAWLITEAIGKGERMDIPITPFGSLIKRCWDHDPKKRPDFTEIYNELQDLKKKLPALPAKDKIPIGKRVLPLASNLSARPSPSSHSASTSSLIPLVLAPNDPGKRMLNGFKQANSLSWEMFEKLYVECMGNPRNGSLSQLKWVLTEGEPNVSRAQVERFLKWFAPLVPDIEVESTYANVSGSSGPKPVTPSSNGLGGYNTAQIAEIVGPTWFHGWLSAEDCKDTIGSASEGTFIFRFSQTPRCFSLSVMHLGNITHWRISSTKESDVAPTIFRIDNREYTSIQDIVMKHAVEPLKVFQLLGSGKEDVFLKKEMPRVIEQDANYANVPKRP